MGVLSALLQRPFLRAIHGRLKRGTNDLGQKLEARGKLEEALAEYASAGARTDSLRVLLKLAQHAELPLDRLRYLTEAIELSDEPDARALRLRRARLCLDLVRSGTRQVLPAELEELAVELDTLGAHETAAEVYALLGNGSAQADMLMRAGAAEEVERVLSAEQERERERRSRRQLSEQLRDDQRIGARRRVYVAARALGSEGAVALRSIELARLLGPRTRLTIDGAARDVVFGTRITVGRAGIIPIQAPSLSREHLAIERVGEVITVRDLGSRNGSRLGDAPLRDAITLTSAVELRLGSEVWLALEPWLGGARLSYAGATLELPLGPLALDGWQLDMASDGWIELSSSGERPAFLSALRAEPELQLCRGDRISAAPNGPPRLCVPES